MTWTPIYPRCSNRTFIVCNVQLNRKHIICFSVRKKRANGRTEVGHMDVQSSKRNSHRSRFKLISLLYSRRRYGRPLRASSASFRQDQIQNALSSKALVERAVGGGLKRDGCKDSELQEGRGKLSRLGRPDVWLAVCIACYHSRGRNVRRRKKSTS
jgi:hypothetical protein